MLGANGAEPTGTPSIRHCSLRALPRPVCIHVDAADDLQRAAAATTELPMSIAALPVTRTPVLASLARRTLVPA